MDSNEQKAEAGAFLLKEVVKDIKSGSTELFLDGKGVDDTIVSAIVRNQLENPTISILDLRNNKIGDDGARLLVELISKSNTLTTVLLDGNNGICEGAAHQLQEAIFNAPSIIKASTDYPRYNIILGNYFDESALIGSFEEKNDVDSYCDGKKEMVKDLCDRLLKNPLSISSGSKEDVQDMGRGAAIIAVTRSEFNEGEQKTIAQNFIDTAVRFGLEGKNIVIPKGMSSLAGRADFSRGLN